MTAEVTYQQSGTRLAQEYVHRLVRDGIDAAQLTAAAVALPKLANLPRSFHAEPGLPRCR